MQKIKISWDLGNRKSLLPEWEKPKIKVLAFIQARETSSRLPQKIYKELDGAPILYHVISRAKESKLIDDAIILSPKKLSDLPENIKESICPNCDGNNECRDVLGEYYWCLIDNPCDYVVRLTADCPLLDPNLIDFVVYQAIITSADYCSNVLKLTFPDGVDTEVIKSDFLKFLYHTTKSPYNREHVTTAIRDNIGLQEEFNCTSVENLEDLSKIKISIDTEEDLQFANFLKKEICSFHLL